MKENKEKYNFLSENTTDLISFHDCCCEHFFYEDGCLVFEMEWLEVLAKHPMNPNSQAYQSGESKVVFVEPQIVECVLHENAYVDGEMISREIMNLTEINFRDAEFLNYHEEKTMEGVRAKMFLLFNDDTLFNSIALEIQFKKSLVMWDELKDTSWFEDEIWKKRTK